MNADRGLNGADAVASIAGSYDGAVFVTTMSSVALLDAVPGERDVFPAVAMMGAASTFGLGLALGRPERRVVVIDGDGSLLMELGSLVTIADAAPPNLLHIVLQNDVWFDGTADLAIPGAGRTDLVGLARSAGYASTALVEHEEELQPALAAADATDGPVFVAIRTKPTYGKRWSDDNPQPDLPDVYFDRVAQQAATLRDSLAASASNQ